jgi:hypothetical protein
MAKTLCIVMLLTKANVKKSNASFDAVRASPASYDCVFTARYRVVEKLALARLNVFGSIFSVNIMVNHTRYGAS